jgi:hypothetical protein
VVSTTDALFASHRAAPVVRPCSVRALFVLCPFSVRSLSDAAPLRFASAQIFDNGVKILPDTIVYVWKGGGDATLGTHSWNETIAKV